VILRKTIKRGMVIPATMRRVIQRATGPDTSQAMRKQMPNLGYSIMGFFMGSPQREEGVQEEGGATT